MQLLDGVRVVLCCGVVCVCVASLAPVDSPLNGLHLAQHGQQQRGFPTTHLAHDHGQLTCTRRSKKKKKSSLKHLPRCFSSPIARKQLFTAPPVGMRMLMSDSVDRLLPQVKNPLVTCTQPNTSVVTSERPREAANVPWSCSHARHQRHQKKIIKINS